MTEAIEIARRFKLVRSRNLRYEFTRNVTDVAFTPIQRLHMLFINVKTGHGE
jgi:hypothetical protein